jgi:hypothetical protein
MCGKSIAIVGVGVGRFRSEVAFFWVRCALGVVYQYHPLFDIVLSLDTLSRSITEACADISIVITEQIGIKSHSWNALLLFRDVAAGDDVRSARPLD